MDRLRLRVSAVKAFFRKAHGIESDSALADELGVTRQAVFNWGKRGEFMPELAALAIIHAYPAIADKARVVRRPTPRKRGGRARD